MKSNWAENLQIVSASLESWNDYSLDTFYLEIWLFSILSYSLRYRQGAGFPQLIRLMLVWYFCLETVNALLYTLEAP